MSKASGRRSRPVNRHTVLAACVGVLLGLGLLAVTFYFVGRHPKESSRRVGYVANLRLLAANLPFYVKEHAGAYPPPETWCDALVEWSNGHLRKALRYPKGEREGCPYAMNPRADPVGPRDVVLLFESEPGWNRTGGPESIRVGKREQTRGEGAYVLFVGGDVRFVPAGEISTLRWDGRGGGGKPDVRPAAGNARRPATREVLEFWLKNMVWYHRFTTDEIRAATGLDEKAILAVQKESSIWPDTRPTLGKDAPLLVLPYPGGRHPRIGFLEGAIDPQRETKFSVFTPWDPSSYVVVDVPEAIWSNLGLTYLAHTHIDTIWTKQGIELPKLEWNRRRDGSLDIERTLPNGIAFGVKAVPTKEAVRMEMWLRNGTGQKLTDLRVQICVMPKMAAGFAGQTNENKVFTNPYVACRSADGRRWIVTAWENCDRPWGNEQCPCFHSDPKFPDLEPGQQSRLHGWLSFYEGVDIQAEFARIEALGWWRDGKAAP
jgi:hypothetical protein